MDNRVEILPTTGVKTAARRLDDWSCKRAVLMFNPAARFPLYVFSPPVKRRLPELAMGILTVIAWSLIALAIFEGATR
jgi:hypothetical protein